LVEGEFENTVITTNTAHQIYQINPYDNGASNKFGLHYKESVYQTYTNDHVQIDLSKLNLNVVVGYQEGMYVEMHLDDKRDQDL
jgi:hypothetical protein